MPYYCLKQPLSDLGGIILSRKFYLSIAALLSFNILFSANTLIAKEQATNTGEVKANPDERRYSPSYITIDGKQHVTVDDWTDPRICGQCHTEQYKGWNGSMHSIAFNDPVFQAEWALAMKSEAAKEIDMINHCGSCHSPIGVATNTIKFDRTIGSNAIYLLYLKADKIVYCVCSWSI